MPPEAASGPGDSHQPGAAASPLVGPSNPAGLSRPALDLWIVDGHAYDLTSFLPHHPGGRIFLDFMRGRDCTAAVRTHHPPGSLGKIMALLQSGRYGRGTVHIDDAALAVDQTELRDEDVLERSLPTGAAESNTALRPVPRPALMPPTFLWPEIDGPFGFAAMFLARTRQNDFSSPLLVDVQQAVAPLADVFRACDRTFDRSVGVVLALYVSLQLLLVSSHSWSSSSCPPSLLSVAGLAVVLLMAMLRTALAGAGHYFLHRAANATTQLGEQLFDLNYVANSYVLRDGHAILHHSHLKSAIDSKEHGSTGFSSLPRLYRWPAHLLHKLAQFASGIAVHQAHTWHEMYSLSNWMNNQPAGRDANGTGGALDEATYTFRSVCARLSFFASKFCLWIECLAWLCSGCGWLWLAQFCATVMWNTFLLVSNHDYALPVPLAQAMAIPLDDASTTEKRIGEQLLQHRAAVAEGSPLLLSLLVLLVCPRDGRLGRTPVVTHVRSVSHGYPEARRVGDRWPEPSCGPSPAAVPAQSVHQRRLAGCCSRCRRTAWAGVACSAPAADTRSSGLPARLRAGGAVPDSPSSARGGMVHARARRCRSGGGLPERAAVSQLHRGASIAASRKKYDRTCIQRMHRIRNHLKRVACVSVGRDRARNSIWSPLQHMVASSPSPFRLRQSRERRPHATHCSLPKSLHTDKMLVLARF